MNFSAVLSAEIAVHPSAGAHTMSNTHVAHLPLHAIKREHIANQALVLALEKTASLCCHNTRRILHAHKKTCEIITGPTGYSVQPSRSPYLTTMLKEI